MAGKSNRLELSVEADLGAEISTEEDRDEKSNPLFFLNRILKDSQNNFFNGPLELAVERIERLAVILWHDKLDEIEAAMYLRLSDPYGKGRETIRYHALRSRKLSFHKIGKSGLIFLKVDLDKALKHFKFESHRDL